MVRLIIVRHAKTDWNIARKIQGRSDIPLSEQGKLDAENAARLLHGKQIDRVICSPLTRARQTAELMYGSGYETDDRLVEREFGEYDGQNYLEMTGRERDSLFGDMENVAGAESCEQIFARTRDFINQIKRECGGMTLAIFSHAVCISFLLFAASHEEWDAAEYSMGYVGHCGIKEVIIE